MCTVVCRFQPGEPVQLLALRDELATREFDLPGEWWVPGVIGGRDRVAGGSWCVTDVAAATTAVVLNNPDKRVADPGAPSRGVLPLVAVEHGTGWTDHVDVTGMAGFNLVLVRPQSLQWWRFDGTSLAHEVLAPGTYTFTPRGLAASRDRRFETAGAHLDDPEAPVEAVWGAWLDVLHATPTSPDPAGFIVRVPVEGTSYETVFGQFIASRQRPGGDGWLRLDHLSHPADGTDRAWSTQILTRRAA